MAVDGRAVLAHVAEGVWQVVRLEARTEPDLPPAEPLFSVWDFPDPALEPIDVADPADASLLALACAAGECKLYGASDGVAPSAPVLTEAALPALPGSFEPSGLAVGVPVDWDGELCAFGNGLICLVDGAWKTAIPAQAGVQILDVLIAKVSVAIGTGGRWYKRDGDAQWIEQARLPAELDFVGTLHEKGAGDGRYDRPVIVGDSRLWKVQSSCAVECSLEKPLVAALGTNLVEADGQNLYDSHDPQRWCKDWVMELGGPVLDASNAPCCLDNPRVLTAERVIGQYFCVAC